MYIEPFWLGFALGIIATITVIVMWGIALNRKERKKKDKNE